MRTHKAICVAISIVTFSCYGCAGLPFPPNADHQARSRLHSVTYAEFEKVTDVVSSTEVANEDSNIVAIFPSQDNEFLYVVREIYRGGMIATELNRLSINNVARWDWPEWSNVGGTFHSAAMRPDGTKMVIVSHGKLEEDNKASQFSKNFIHGKMLPGHDWLDVIYPGLWISWNKCYVTLIDLTNGERRFRLFPTEIFMPSSKKDDYWGGMIFPKWVSNDGRLLLWMEYVAKFGGGKKYLYASPLLWWDEYTGKEPEPFVRMDTPIGTGVYPFLFAVDPGNPRHVHVIGKASKHCVFDIQTGEPIGPETSFKEIGFMNPCIDLAVVDSRILLCGDNFLATMTQGQEGEWELRGRQLMSSYSNRYISVSRRFVIVYDPFPKTGSSSPSFISLFDRQDWDKSALEIPIEQIGSFLNSHKFYGRRVSPHRDSQEIIEEGAPFLEIPGPPNVTIVGDNLFVAAIGGTKILKYDLRKYPGFEQWRDQKTAPSVPALEPDVNSKTK